MLFVRIENHCFPACDLEGGVSMPGSGQMVRRRNMRAFARVVRSAVADAGFPGVGSEYAVTVGYGSEMIFDDNKTLIIMIKGTFVADMEIRNHVAEQVGRVVKEALQSDWQVKVLVSHFDSEVDGYWTSK